jgi:hypothetical protein
VEHRNEVWLSHCPAFSILGDHAETFHRFFQVAVVDAVDQRAGVGDAGAACNIANIPECLSSLIFSATFVIAEVMVPVMVTGGVGGDNHPPRRGFEGLDNR